MIVTCASCLTKYNLDDSRVKPKGVKVRCSRCKHVFWVVPPPETKEEVIEDFEAFAKYHEELIGPAEKEAPAPQEEKLVEEKPPVEEKFIFEERHREERVEEARPSPEEEFLFEERAKLEEGKEVPTITPPLEEEKKIEIPKPKKILREEKRIFPFVLVGIIVIVILGLAYFWGDIGSVKKITSYLDTPIKKFSDLWNRVLGKEKEGLIIGNLNGYEEKAGEHSIFIIEGKINNQSGYTKKHVKLKISIFDRNKTKVAEKEIIGGKALTRDELKNLSAEFLKGDLVIKPKSERESIIESGKEVPFMVIFKDIPPNATEFSVEIVEAPNI